MSRSHLLTVAKRLGISAFIVLNLSAVLFVNLPPAWRAFSHRKLAENLPRGVVHRVHQSAWALSSWGYYTGLDSRWQMFGYQSRFNWWYTIRAQYGDGTHTANVALPTPNQSVRTLVDRWVWDIKERKFQLNLYNNAPAREAYSRYLARQYPEHNGLPIQSIEWHLGYQMVVPPSEAVKRQELREPRVQKRLLNRFPVSAAALHAEVSS